MTSEAGDSDQTIVLRQIADDDSFTSFKCGEPDFTPLKRFAQKSAKAYERSSLARTYVILDKAHKRIAAYITLVSSEIRSEASLVSDKEAHFPYQQYPAVKIARLLVDERYRADAANGKASRKLGSTLVDFALDVTKTEVSGWVGCRFLVVDAKIKSVSFYERCGFTLLDTPENKSRAEKLMFIDLSKL